MTLDFGSAAAFWLLGLIPAVWVAGGLRRAGLGARHSLSHAGVRAVVLVCLISAIAQPFLSVRSSRSALVYLVDASDSVSTNALEAAADAIDELTAAVRPDEWRILAFGGRVAALADSNSLRRLRNETATNVGDDPLAPTVTNLEQALVAARAEIPASANGRIVLLSDGRETEGDSRRVAERLAAERVPVFTKPLPVRDVGDTWIDSVRLPHAPIMDAVAVIEIALSSQAVRTVEVMLREGSRVLGRREIQVAVGRSVVSMEVSFAATGPHLLEAALVAPGDVLSENNTLLHEVVVGSPPRVLYVHAPTDDARAAPIALARAGVKVTMAKPEDLPTTPVALEQWDVVILSNVARTQITVGAMAALGSWVEEGGGGLLMIGGDAVRGDGLDRSQQGYRGTELERVLPVTFDRDETDVALVIVLDRSWSMNGVAMDLSKAAAEAAANTLAPSQMLGVLTFNNDSNWDVPLAYVRESRPTLHDAIDKITASGPTAIYPALENAYDALTSVRARAKHVILLSDGQTPAEDFEGLVRKMTAARITLSSVALGPEADAALLGNIAKWGGGRSYVVHDARQIPEIFVKEAKTSVTPEKEPEGASVLAVRLPGFFSSDVTNLPGLYGRNAVTRKPAAIDLLSTTRGEPILTIWPAGLGRTGIFAADVDGRWTRDWLRWPGFGAFVSTVVRALATEKLPPAALSVVAGEGQGSQRTLNVSLEMSGRDAEQARVLVPTIHVRQGAAASAEAGSASLRLMQVAPRRYETRVVADTRLPLTFSLAESRGAPGVARVFVTDQAAEYRFGVPDDALLAEIARVTGGSVNPTADDLRRAPEQSTTSRHPVAPWLLGVGLVLWLADIGLRRLLR